ncbi:hypothetical protein [Oribacterium sp. P6A1]|uniref:hypothetical protein n=1 Tax=Oribacterium sp. P6A1 TaxID=1410612 RepID=UPI000AFBFBC0|nr:hypothetical protein [Oribacterium sp. P6A1]
MDTKKTVKDHISDLKKENKRVHIIAYFMMAVLVGVLIVSLRRQFYLTFGLLIIALMIQFFVFRKAQKKYIKHCEDVNIALTLKEPLNASEIQEKGTYITEETLKKAHIIPFVPKTFNGFKAIKGERKGIEVSATDISVVERKNDKGIAAEVNTGNWIHIVLPEGTGKKLCIVEDDLMRNSARTDFFSKDSYREYDLPEGFPKRFHIYESSETKSSEAKSSETKSSETKSSEAKSSETENNETVSEKKLSESFLAKLKSLSDYTPGKLGVCISDDTVDVFIKNRFLAAGFTAGQEVDERTLLRDPYPELMHVLDMVEFL